MSFGSRLKERREELGLKQSELGKLLGVTGSAIGNYENGISSPKADVLYQVFNVLKCDANYLFQDEMKELESDDFTVPEIKIIKKYRALDQHGKNTVTAVLDCEKARCDDASTSPATGKVIELYPTRKYLQSTSAGYGDFNDDASYEMVDLVKRPPAGTSFIIAVNGHSMEPTFNDGDLVFVHSQETIRVGEIGLFVRGGDLYIKESGPDGLISHNKSGKYPLIVSNDDMPILTEGKIIGICTSEYF